MGSTLCLGSVPSRCCSHPFPSPGQCWGGWVGALVHCQDCTFLTAKDRGRANGRQERKQMQESSEVILLHICLSSVFVYAWVFMQPEPALPRVWVCRWCKATAPLSPVLGDTSLMTLGCEWGSVPSAAIIGKLCLFLQEQHSEHGCWSPISVLLIALIPHKLPLQFPSVILFITSSFKLWIWHIQGRVGSCWLYFNDTAC